MLPDDDPATLDDGTRTFELRYVGYRFADARLPVSVLPDLSAFRDLLVAFAKKRWFASHEKRKRLPKGFDQTLAFDLIGISEGSAVPKIEWTFHEAQRDLPGFKDEILSIVDESYDDVVQLFRAADNGRPHEILSSDHIKALNKFGSGLRENERIEFVGSRTESGEVVYLDNLRRKNLITRVRETYQLRVDGSGRLSGVHAEGRIHVETEKYGEIILSIEPDRIVSEFDGNIGASVQFSVTVELDHNDKVSAVREVHEVDVSDSDPLTKCLDRVDAMKHLPRGWYDGQGEIITSSAIRQVKEFLHKRLALIHLYSIYPNADGGILIELEKNNWCISIEFSPSGSSQIIATMLHSDEDYDSPIFDDLNSKFFEVFDKLTSAE